MIYKKEDIPSLKLSQLDRTIFNQVCAKYNIKLEKVTFKAYAGSCYPIKTNIITIEKVDEAIKEVNKDANTCGNRRINTLNDLKEKLLGTYKEKVKINWRRESQKVGKNNNFFSLMKCQDSQKELFRLCMILGKGTPSKGFMKYEQYYFKLLESVIKYVKDYDDRVELIKELCILTDNSYGNMSSYIDNLGGNYNVNYKKYKNIRNIYKQLKRKQNASQK